MIDGVIFDMDGLMFDTERVWATLWAPALATLGLSYKEGLDVAARGTAGDTMRAVLRRFYGENCDTDAIIEALHAQAEKAFQAPPPKKPGLDEILTWLDAQHIPMAVASSSRMASIRHHLDGWGLTHYFKVIVSGEQFSASKPDPEIFLRAAEALGTARDRTLVLTIWCNFTGGKMKHFAIPCKTAPEHYNRNQHLCHKAPGIVRTRIKGKRETHYVGYQDHPHGYAQGKAHR